MSDAGSEITEPLYLTADHCPQIAGSADDGIVGVHGPSQVRGGDVVATVSQGLDAPRPQLRRDAAIRVAQMATGRSRRSAALYLGNPLGSLHSATISIRTWQKEPGNASAYRRALHRVAEIAIAQGQAERGGAGGG
jgi:hypothetical protein